MTAQDGEDTSEVPTPSNSEILIESPLELRNADWGETWTNIGAPTLFGVIVGSLWQWQIVPRLSSVWPNPVQGSLLVMLLLSPLFHRLLTSHEFSRWKEYALGVLLPGLYIAAVWFIPGQTGLFCVGYLATIAWVWMCTSWWRFELPPFRSAVWHTLGVNIGALGASILTFNLMM